MEGPALLRTIAKLTFCINAALTIRYAYKVAKYEIEKLAARETVTTPQMYVLVKACRGQYSATDVNQIREDWRFFDQIKNFHE